MGSEDWTVAAWRVDGEEAKIGTWDLLGDDTIKARNPSQLIRDLQEAEKIAALVHREFAESITAVWYPEGFAEAYKPVEETCDP